MKKIYLKGKCLLLSLLLIIFSFSFQNVKAQTCTSNDPTLCALAVPDLCANFTGNALTSITTANLSFTGTATATATKLSLFSRTYTVTATDGCVLVKFNEVSTGTVTSTDVTITTNTGLTLTCTNVVVDLLGNACVKICDSRLIAGTLITVRLDFNATTNFTTGQTVTVTSFATVGVATCTLPTFLLCPTSYIALNNDCGPSCDGAYPLSAGKIRVFFAQPIPIGQPTPIATLNAIGGVNVALNQFKLCLTADAGTTVQRTYADYCIYTNSTANLSLLNLTGSLTLTLQSGSTSSGACIISVCAGGTFAVLNNTSGCTATCDALYPTLAGKIRIFFNSPIPIGTPTPTITAVTVAGLDLSGYKLCLTADAGSNVVRTYADYCIYSTLTNIVPFPNNLPITFNTLTGAVAGSICTTPVTVPCSSGFVQLNTGGAFGGPPAEVACPSPGAGCNPTFVVVSRLRIYFTPCLPAGIPTPTITGAEGLNAAGIVTTPLLTPLINRFCFVATAESNQSIATQRCYVDYCVYGAAGDTYFSSPDAQIRFTFDFGILANGLTTPLIQVCPSPGPKSTTILNPDVNVTTVNVPVPGNVRTNDVVPGGTTYGTPVPVLVPGNPAGATINMNPDGTYTFTAITAGVYYYRVPVCAPGVTPPPPCPTTELKITVLDNTSTINPPVANTDITTTPLNTPVTVNVLANDKCSNPGCTLNTASVTIITPPAPANGTAAVTAGGTITYTPTSTFTGLDSLTYRVCDNGGRCATAKVYITVLPGGATNTTTAADDYAVTSINTPVIGNVQTNDHDAEGNTQTVTAQNITTAQYTFTLNSVGAYTFTPLNGFTGPVSFVYTTCDNGVPSVCASATLYILVTPLAVAGPLPIRLVTFNGVREESRVQLTWQTASEQNSNYFEVQFSANSNQWQSIGKVNAAGVSTSTRDYSLTHNTPVSGINYYRLKQVDKDDKFVYSNVVAISFAIKGLQINSVYPIPFVNRLKIDISSDRSEVVSVQLSDNLGRVLKVQKASIQKGVNGIVLDNLAGLSSGIYNVEVKTSSSSFRVKVKK